MQNIYNLIKINLIRNEVIDLNKHLIKEEIIGKQEHKKLFTSLLIWEMQTKTAVRYYDIPNRMASMQKTDSLKSCQEFRSARNIEHCYCTSCVTIVEESVVGSYKFENIIRF